MKYKENPDRETVNFIKQRLNDNNGYCPGISSSYGKEEYKCPCDRFYNETEKGETCPCGLYVKVKK